MDKSKVKKILVISLSNIGDVILTFPVLDILKHDFPRAKISVILGPKCESLLKGNINFERIYPYEKRQPLRKILPWLGELRKERFDMVVDLRNTAIPFFLGARYRTSFILKRDKTRHMREQHLNRLRSVYPFTDPVRPFHSVFTKPEDRIYIDDIIRREISHPDKIVVVNSGSADDKKHWNKEKFAEVCDYLMNDLEASIVFPGNSSDKERVTWMQSHMRHQAVDLTGRSNLAQTAYLLTRSKMLISNDTSLMHLGSYLNIPVIAIFGPSNWRCFGPLSKGSIVVNNDEDVKLVNVPAVKEAILKSW